VIDLAIRIAKMIAKPFEGLRLRVYLCPAGFWTIGYGSRCEKEHPPITKDQAEALLDRDMMIALKGVLRHCPILLSESPERIGAIIDFVFNLGTGRLQTSTLRRRINQRDWPEVAYELKRWVRGGGRILPGLVARREAEARYFQ